MAEKETEQEKTKRAAIARDPDVIVGAMQEIVTLLIAGTPVEDFRNQLIRRGAVLLEEMERSIAIMRRSLAKKGATE